MPAPILVTKLFVPVTRPELVRRSRLMAQLDAGLHRKLTLVAAPAGFGKTTLVAEWLRNLEATPARAATWFSLDAGDNELARFLTYFIAALNHIEGLGSLGAESLALLDSPQPPDVGIILTPLINEIASVSNQIILVLDDYHLVDSPPINEAATFLIENQPPSFHLVITTRENPLLPLSRLRAREQLTELRAADLRFTESEAAEFLNRTMGLNLSARDIAALESRTEGWIVGLQMAAISLQGPADISQQIKTFAGSNRLVLDYLIEEVLNQLSEDIQAFLFQTAILNRLCGQLCDAVTQQNNGQQVLEHLEKANLFVVPLDNERQWYRYHHLFADLLRKQLLKTNRYPESELNRRASQWYEDNGLEIEAFQHAAAANDYERAERLIEGNGMPLSFRGVVTPVLDWLDSLSKPVLDSRPSLWITYAQTELTIGRMMNIEKKLQNAETALEGVELDVGTKDLIGRIASVRANVAVGHRQVETLLAQSQRALEYLHPDNLTHRTATIWKLGVAYEFQGNRAEAKLAYEKAISISKESGNVYTQILATTGLANILFSENQLHQADVAYRQVLALVGDLPIPVAPHVHLCLAKIAYEWNDLKTAQQQGDECFQVAQPYRTLYDIFVACQVLFARLKIAQGDLAGAEEILTRADRFANQHKFEAQIPEIAATRVLTFLKRGDLVEAAQLAAQHEIPLSQARVHLAQKDASPALALLRPLRQQAEATGMQDQRLKVLVLESIAHNVQGETKKAFQRLSEALNMAESESFIRTFIDEGLPMARLLYTALSDGIAPDYVQRLLAAFPEIDTQSTPPSKLQSTKGEWIEPLTEREMDVLKLIAEGLTNQEIGNRLYLSLNTIKVYTRNIYGKLGVNNRTQAVLRARSIGILSQT